MPKIHVLSEILASQVAAGEVVERPASVVKELIENSLDAGSTHILVELQRGGTALIRVTDNGCGMSEEDALLSLERHATSKLKNAEDLMQITTMGFRGEAVPSVASVSRFRLSTQERGAIEGTEIKVEGGKLVEVKKTGVSDGTVIEVKQLFFNVPARRKFLKTESTESAHVEHQIRLHALSAPQVRFTYKKEGKVLFDLPATKDSRVRIIGLMGQSISGSLTEITPYERYGMKARGFLLPADFSRRGKRQQFIFLNGRPVEDAAISRALKDGFRGAVGEGMNPSAWLWLEMNPAMVDVNVHPAKREVRFQRPHDIRTLVTEAVERALTKDQPRASEPKIVSKMHGSTNAVGNITELNRQPLSESPKEKATPSATEEITQKLSIVPGPSSSEPPSFPEKKSVPSIPTASWNPVNKHHQPELTPQKSKTVRPAFQLLAVLHSQYILMQGEEGLVVLEPKAARERIVYEKIMSDAGEVTSQGLLIPEVIELDAYDFDIVKRNLDHFFDAGIQIEAFGGSSFQVSGMPEMISIKDTRSFITQFIDELIATQETKKGKVMSYDLFAKRFAKRAAAEEKAELQHTDALLEQLFACDLPYCDPAGEPTLVQIALPELHRKFGKR